MSLSLAPIRVKMRSTRLIRKDLAGTKHPIYARIVRIQAIRKDVDFPPMLGPVSRMRLLLSFAFPLYSTSPKRMSFGMNFTPEALTQG